MCWQSADYVHEGSPVTSAVGNRAAVSFSVRGLGRADGTFVPDSSTIGCRAPGRVAGRLPTSSSVSETLDYLGAVLRSSITVVGRRYRKPRAGAMHNGSITLVRFLRKFGSGRERGTVRREVRRWFDRGIDARRCHVSSIDELGSMVENRCPLTCAHR